MKYRVLVGLTYPTDPKIWARLAAGKPVAPGTWDETRAEPGAVIELDPPAESLQSLLDQGVIEPDVPAEPEGG